MHKEPLIIYECIRNYPQEMGNHHSYPVYELVDPNIEVEGPLKYFGTGAKLPSLDDEFDFSHYCADHKSLAVAFCKSLYTRDTDIPVIGSVVSDIEEYMSLGMTPWLHDAPDESKGNIKRTGRVTMGKDTIFDIEFYHNQSMVSTRHLNVTVTHKGKTYNYRFGSRINHYSEASEWHLCYYAVWVFITRHHAR